MSQDRGAPGERGPKGDHGQAGDTGDVGIDGQRGWVGERGDRGDSGDRGIAGERGPKGDHGQHGEQGARGAEGVQGAEGAEGVQGLPGGFVAKRTSQVIGVLMGLVLLLGGVAVYNVDQLDKEVQRTEFRALDACVRQNINSALVTLNSQRPQANFTPLRIANARRRARNLYPVLDCRRAILTGETVQLAEAEKAKYVRHVDRGRAPVVRDGKVVGSRSSVLQGVKSVDDAGN